MKISNSRCGTFSDTLTRIWTNFWHTKICWSFYFTNWIAIPNRNFFFAKSCNHEFTFYNAGTHFLSSYSDLSKILKWKNNNLIKYSISNLLLNRKMSEFAASALKNSCHLITTDPHISLVYYKLCIHDSLILTLFLHRWYTDAP